MDLEQGLPRIEVVHPLVWIPLWGSHGVAICLQFTHQSDLVATVTHYREMEQEKETLFVNNWVLSETCSWDLSSKVLQVT